MVSNAFANYQEAVNLWRRTCAHYAGAANVRRLAESNKECQRAVEAFEFHTRYLQRRTSIVDFRGGVRFNGLTR